MQKLGQNTNEIIKYLNSEGYYMSVKKKIKSEKLVTFKNYRTKHKLKVSSKKKKKKGY